MYDFFSIYIELCGHILKKIKASVYINNIQFGFNLYIYVFILFIIFYLFIFRYFLLYR